MEQWIRTKGWTVKQVADVIKQAGGGDVPWDQITSIEVLDKIRAQLMEIGYLESESAERKPPLPASNRTQ